VKPQDAKSFDLASVSFAPVEETAPVQPPEAVQFTPSAPVARMEAELAPRLRELARRSRRLGPTNEGAVLLLAGCDQHSGVSSLALALARVASAECTIMFVDGNLLNAATSRRAVGAVQHDWIDVLLGQCALADAQRAFDERLVMLPLKERADWQATLPEYSLKDLITAARQERELIVIDGGPIASCRWTKCADAALLVCDPRRTPQKHWAPAWDRLESGGAQVMGVVEVNTTFPEYQC
jgi:Mrp family chromosome partitioning ATPase